MSRIDRDEMLEDLPALDAQAMDVSWGRGRGLMNDIGQRLNRPTWVEINLDHLSHKVREVRRVIGPERKLIAVAKGDAYGHGITRAAPVMEEAGADVIAVANLSDAIRLHETGFGSPILLFGSALAQDVATTVVKYGIIPTVWEKEHAEAYAAVSPGPVEVYMKVDTGLKRIGVSPEKAVSLARSLA